MQSKIFNYCKKEYAYIKYRKEKNVRLIQRVHAKYDQRYLLIVKKSMHILNIEKENNLRLNTIKDIKLL